MRTLVSCGPGRSPGPQAAHLVRVKVKSFHCEFTVRCKHLTCCIGYANAANSQWKCCIGYANAASCAFHNPQPTVVGCGIMLHWRSQCSIVAYFFCAAPGVHLVQQYAALAKPMQQSMLLRSIIKTAYTGP